MTRRFCFLNQIGVTLIEIIVIIAVFSVTLFLIFSLIQHFKSRRVTQTLSDRASHLITQKLNSLHHVNSETLKVLCYNQNKLPKCRIESQNECNSSAGEEELYGTLSLGCWTKAHMTELFPHQFCLQLKDCRFLFGGSLVELEFFYFLTDPSDKETGYYLLRKSL
ncbi:MAG: hypothetical protein RMK80_04715 [Pseudobdellovibrionaceae bacterium]|nr:hypothetical protein [Pseudobdellovibrionaceae bacterium]